MSCRLVQGFLPNEHSRACEHGADAWAAYASMKGLPPNLGNEGGSFQDFKEFPPVEMIVFIVLITLNGLTPSMGFECEFKTQEEVHMTENYLCAREIGDNLSRRWNELRCFSLVNHRVTPPSNDVLPNYKIQGFLNHMHDAIREAWIPGKTFLIMWCTT